jgi:hypothetical protein
MIIALKGGTAEGATNDDSGVRVLPGEHPGHGFAWIVDFSITTPYGTNVSIV